MLRSSVTRAQFRVASLTEQYNKKVPRIQKVQRENMSEAIVSFAQPAQCLLQKEFTLCPVCLRTAGIQRTRR